MRPTRWWVLLAAAVVAAAVAFVVTRSSYDGLPQPTVLAVLWLGLLTIAEFYIAMVTRARLGGRAGTRPIDPLVVARLVALAKASSFGGSIAGGGYLGYLSWTARLESPTASHDTTIAAVSAASSLLLVAAGLFLEYVCRVPTPPDAD